MTRHRLAEPDTLEHPALRPSGWPPAWALILPLAPFVVGGVWLGSWWLDQPATVLPPVVVARDADPPPTVAPVTFTSPPTTGSARAVTVAPPTTSTVRTTPARAVAAVTFVDCDQARAAGRSNIPASDPRYGAHLDRDGDGIGCEVEPPEPTTPTPDSPPTTSVEPSSSVTSAPPITDLPIIDLLPGGSS